MKSFLAAWQFWAFAAAGFAALTAIFAKIGVEGVGSDFANLIRTVVILAVVTLLVFATGQWQPLASVSQKTWLFLALSGVATGLSWLCYFRALKMGDAARVAPLDKLSVVIVAVIATLILGEKLSGPTCPSAGMITAGGIRVVLKT